MNISGIFTSQSSLRLPVPNCAHSVQHQSLAVVRRSTPLVHRATTPALGFVLGYCYAHDHRTWVVSSSNPGFQVMRVAAAVHFKLELRFRAVFRLCQAKVLGGSREKRKEGSAHTLDRARGTHIHLCRSNKSLGGNSGKLSKVLVQNPDFLGGAPAQMRATLPKRLVEDWSR